MIMPLCQQHLISLFNYLSRNEFPLSLEISPGIPHKVNIFSTSFLAMILASAFLHGKASIHPENNYKNILTTHYRGNWMKSTCKCSNGLVGCGEALSNTIIVFPGLWVWRVRCWLETNSLSLELSPHQYFFIILIILSVPWWVAECRAFGNNGTFKDLGRTRRTFGPSMSHHLILNLYPRWPQHCCFRSGAWFCLIYTLEIIWLETILRHSFKLHIGTILVLADLPWKSVRTCPWYAGSVFLVKIKCALILIIAIQLGNRMAENN